MTPKNQTVGTGRINCNVRGCEDEAEWYWKNPISRNEGWKCNDHARGLETPRYSFMDMVEDGIMMEPSEAPEYAVEETANTEETDL